MPSRLRVLAVALVALITACGGEKATGPAPVAAITISPAMLSLKVGETQALTASLNNAKDASLTGRTISWSSADQAIAQVSTAIFLNLL